MLRIHPLFKDDASFSPCREYFKMRFHKHGNTDWLRLKWKGATISHTTQEDGFSCGVFVMEVSRT